MSIVPVRRSTASDQIFGQLAENIRNGTWSAGRKIPSENDLAASFGTSRVTVRHALSRLTTLGLLEVRSGEGSFVRPVRPGGYLQSMIPFLFLGNESTEEVLEFRIVTEVKAASLAVTRISDADIGRLEQTLEQMKLLSDHFDEFVSEDLLFHTIITEATENSLLIQLSYSIRDILRTTIRNLTAAGGAEMGIRYHTALIRAFRERDGSKAEEAMRDHLNVALAAYKSTMKDTAKEEMAGL